MLRKQIALSLMIVVATVACSHGEEQIAKDPAAAPAAEQKPAEVAGETPKVEAAAPAAAVKAPEAPVAAVAPVAAAPVVVAAKKTMYVSATKLNVRSGAALDAKILRTVAYRGSVEVLSLEGEWAKVGEGEFVAAKFLSEVMPKKKVAVKKAAPAAVAAPAAEVPVTQPAPADNTSAPVTN